MKRFPETLKQSAVAGSVWRVEPLADPRWPSLVETHPFASVFHCPQWLEALRRTYGYQPIAYTTSPPGEPLTNAILFCQVTSWLTGNRLVSLPFSDHCQPLVEDGLALEELCHAVEHEVQLQNLNYFEMRPRRPTGFQGSMHRSCFTYCLHMLDLSPDADQLFRAFHKDSVQRKVRRAEREGLTYAEGRDERMLEGFFTLMVKTRRRHSAPPQPKAWFRNLGDCFGDSLKIRTAYRGAQPVASILTIQFRRDLVYKYGCSDEAYSQLGGTQYLFWKTIQEAKANHLKHFDLGRSDSRQTGLITFKERWGARAEELEYVRFTRSLHSFDNYKSDENEWKELIVRSAVRMMPTRVFRMFGEFFYKHIG